MKRELKGKPSNTVEGKLTLRQLRALHYLKAPVLAEELGVAVNAVYRWENGDSVPSLEHAFELAERYGVGVGDINWWPKAFPTEKNLERVSALSRA